MEPMVPLTDVDPAHAELPELGSQIAAMRERVQTANAPGNLDGIMARYILIDYTPLNWNVDPLGSTWFADNQHRLDEPAALAVLGYADAASSPTQAAAAMELGLRRLMQRNLFPGDRVSVLYDMRILLGLRLAIDSMSKQLPQAAGWLRDSLTDPRLLPADGFQALVQQHVHATLIGQPIRLTGASELAADVAELLPTDAGPVRSALLTESGGPRRSQAELLRAVGIDLNEVRSAVRRTFGAEAVESLGRRGVHQPWQPWKRPSRRCTSLLAGTVHVAPRLKQAMETARDHADRREAVGIAPAGLLFGILDVEGSMASRMLRDVDVEPDSVLHALRNSGG
jgi:hypothetical protein